MTNPMNGGFATTFSEGNADPEKRKAGIHIEWRGEGAAEKAFAAMDYLDRLVKADQSADGKS